MNDVRSSKSLFSETLLQIANTIPITSATAEHTLSALPVESKVISPINHVTGMIKSLHDITHLQGKH